jgi:hypothetical protein
MRVDGVPVPLPEPTGIDHGPGESGGGPRVHDQAVAVGGIVAEQGEVDQPGGV